MVVYVYVVAAAGQDPNRIRCPVPWQVDEREIFFGACKKRLREKLRDRFLGPDIGEATAQDDIWLVGLFPSGRAGPRNILFAGRVTRIMTFARAHDVLVGPRYAKMRERDKSPIHLRPIYRNDALIGYEHRGTMHSKNGAWVTDLAIAGSQNVRVEGEKVLVKGTSPWDALPRDATFTLELLFWGPGRRSLTLDDEAVRLLEATQPGARMISSRAPFGLDRSGAAVGLRGTYLTLGGSVADGFMAWIRQRASD